MCSFPGASNALEDSLSACCGFGLSDCGNPAIESDRLQAGKLTAFLGSQLPAVKKAPAGLGRGSFRVPILFGQRSRASIHRLRPANAAYFSFRDTLFTVRVSTRFPDKLTQNPSLGRGPIGEAHL
jgi:hypothetical protein